MSFSPFLSTLANKNSNKNKGEEMINEIDINVDLLHFYESYSTLEVVH